MSAQKLFSKKIRLHFLWGLVFFLVACSDKKKTEDQDMLIWWENGKAISLRVNPAILPGLDEDSLSQWLQVRLAGNTTAVLGEYVVSDISVIFIPVIPFTLGSTYEVSWKDKLIGSVKIIPEKTPQAPSVVAIFPGNNFLPQNLLKIYIEFTKPMQEGKTLENISVIKNGRDTIPSVFLDLQPELWNHERTILTLWLDPGRTKRDLQPNMNLGSPLEKGAEYEIIIHKDWADEQGIPLSSIYSKKFMTAERDTVSPDPLLWNIITPKAGTILPLTTEMAESIDYMLLKNAIWILDSKDQPVTGAIEPKINETSFMFFPEKPWKAGTYNMVIESRLEDLAGNNLNRLFDKDISVKENRPQKDVYILTFAVK